MVKKDIQTRLVTYLAGFLFCASNGALGNSYGIKKVKDLREVIEVFVV